MISMYETFVQESAWSATPAVPTVLGSFTHPQKIFDKTLNNKQWYKDNEIDVKDDKKERSRL